MIPGVVKPEDHVLVIFGATGDLARRKLLPGLRHLAASGMLPDGYLDAPGPVPRYAPGG